MFQGIQVPEDHQQFVAVDNPRMAVDVPSPSGRAESPPPRDAGLFLSGEMREFTMPASDRGLLSAGDRHFLLRAAELESFRPSTESLALKVIRAEVLRIAVATVGDAIDQSMSDTSDEGPLLADDRRPTPLRRPPVPVADGGIALD